MEKSVTGEVCTVPDDCVEGLICSYNYVNYVCSCPSSECEYDSRLGSCDCGIASTSTPAAVICIGSTLGVLSFLFWINFIARTYFKLRARRENINSSNLAAEVEMESINANPQMNPGFDGQKVNIAKYNDPPPPYTSVVGNPIGGATGFAPPAYYATSIEPPSRPPSYSLYPQIQNETVSFSSQPLGREISLHYQQTPPVSPSYQNVPMGNNASLPYPLSPLNTSYPPAPQYVGLPTSFGPNVSSFVTPYSPYSVPSYNIPGSTFQYPTNTMPTQICPYPTSPLTNQTPSSYPSAPSLPGL